MPHTNFEYEDILDALEEGNAVFFLGPQLLQGADGQPLEEALYSHLDARNPEHSLIRRFYEEDGFYLLHEENCRRRLVRRMRKFYEQPPMEATSVLEKLARLPIPLFISLTPDHLLEHAFNTKRQDYLTDFYYRNQPFESFIAPTTERPLLYQMLGNISQPDSMVLTHKDLFSYLQSIFAGKSMAPELRKLIQDTRTFIFLGLPFEKWYMQLLLRVLYHISSRLESLEQYASSPNGRVRHQIFEDEFKIKFVPNAGIEFIEKVYQLCEEENLLKPIPDESPRLRYRRLLQEAQQHLRANEVEKAIKKLHEIVHAHVPLTEAMQQHLFQLEQKFNHLEHLRANNMAAESDKVELNQTIYNLIKLSSDLKKLLEL